MIGINKKKLDGFEMNQHFSNCSIRYIPTDGRLMAINDKYLAMPWIVPGAINIVKSNNPGNLSYNNYGIFRYENSSILDMEFSPFNSNVLAYSTDNNSVVMTSIKEENNSIQFKSMSYKNHNRKISFINFNPIASNVICSCTTHGELHVWDTAKLRSFVEYNEVEFPNSISWSPNGSVIGISSKDKNFNIYDPRNNNISFTTRISQKFSNNKFAWIDDNSIATTGWNTQGHKILSLLDIRKSDNFYSSIIVNKKANQTNISNIFVNPELKLIYSLN